MEISEGLGILQGCWRKNDVRSCNKENDRHVVIGDCVADAVPGLFDFGDSCQNKAGQSGIVFVGAPGTKRKGVSDV